MKKLGIKPFYYILWASLLNLASLEGGAQSIPSNRTYVSSWSEAGYSSTIPSYDLIVNVKDFGAVADGVTDDSFAFQQALNSLGTNSGVVFFPAGTYRLTSSYTLPDHVVIRGERSSNTTLKFDVAGHCLRVLGAADGYQPLIGGYNHGSTMLIVSNGATFEVGDTIEIQQESDPAWGTSTWASHVAGQLFKVTAITNQSLYLDQPLRLSFQNQFNPEIRRINPVEGVGFENIKIERLLNGTIPNQYSIYFKHAANCWVRGVEGYKAFGAHIAIHASTKISILGNYFHEAHSYGGGGSGYGVKLENHTGDCLIENNIFEQLRHAMLLQWGANGNVFGYNYTRQVIRTEFPTDYGGDLCGHGNYPYANLFEGNIAQNIHLDSSHNANGPHHTFFRNRVENYGILITESNSHGQHFVGNEITGSGFFKGLYSLQSTNHIEHGNQSVNSGTLPPGTGNIPEYSYYLSKNPLQPPVTPSWWTIPASLPTIGYPTSFNTGTIPAKERYDTASTYTVGGPSLAVQPKGANILQGSTYDFFVGAYGTPVATFSWYKNGTLIPGATNATLTIQQAKMIDAGMYFAVISDADGVVTSSIANLTVEPVSPCGVPVSWYQAYGLTNATLDEIDIADSDQDGLLNWEEFQASTDPTNQASVLKITEIELTNNLVRLSWQGGSQSWFTVEKTHKMPMWESISTNMISTTLYLNVPTNKTQFFRIKAMRRN